MRFAPARARRERGELLHEALRAPVEAGGQRRLVGGGDDDRLDAGRPRPRAGRSSFPGGSCRRTPRGRPRPSRRACTRRGGRRRRVARRRASASRRPASRRSHSTWRYALQGVASRAPGGRLRARPRASPAASSAPAGSRPGSVARAPARSSRRRRSPAPAGRRTAPGARAPTGRGRGCSSTACQSNAGRRAGVPPCAAAALGAERAARVSIAAVGRSSCRPSAPGSGSLISATM